MVILWPPKKAPFSTGFIWFLDKAEWHVTFSENPNVLLSFQVPFCDFDSKIIKVRQVL